MAYRLERITYDIIIKSISKYEQGESDMKLKKRILGILLIVVMVVGYIPALNMSYAADDIDSGVYDGVPWRITSDYELIIGEEGQECSFGDTWLNMRSFPWEDSTTKYNEYIKKVRFEGKVHGTGTMSYMFYRFLSATEIDLTGFDTSNVTNMEDMFLACHNLTSIDLSGLDTSNVTDMNGMFTYNFALKSIDLSGLDTSKVTDMNGMFYKCEALESADLSGLDLSNARLDGLFNGCKALKNVNLKNVVTSNVTDMRAMFSDCDLTSLDLSSFDASNVTDMSYMFYRCSSLKVLKTGKGFNLATDNNKAEFPVDMYDYESGTLYERDTPIPSTDYRVYVSDLSIDPDEIEEPDDPDPETDTSRVDGGFTTSYNDKEKIIPYKYGFRYRDEYFTGDATGYKHNLATMSLCLALSGYGYGEYSTYDKNVKTLMEQCGFADGDYYESYHYNEKPTKDSIACAIGCKMIEINGSEVPVIAVAVRSSGYEAEWASNLTIGDSGNHDGFDRSAETVKNYIIDYITNKQIKGDIKIWITGFSRGAAVATQTAAKLDDLAGFAYPNESSESGYTRVDFDNTSIYAYGFATPAGVLTSNDPHSSKYSNIYNIIEYNDPVPLVAPENWSFDRYGTTKILPYRESNDSEDFRRYIELLELRVDAGNGYNIDEFKNYNFAYQIAKKNHDTQGTFLRKTVNALAKTIGSRSKYNDKYQATVRKAIENKYANKKNDKYLTTDIIDALIENVPIFAVLHPNLSVTLTENLETLAEVHADTDYYLGWMQMMDRNYDNSLPLVWGNPNYRVWKSNCPVDVYVYDANNNLVASIVNEEPSDDENQEIIVSIDENGQKIAYLPVDSDYRVEVKAREACEVSCGVEEYNAEFGESARVVNFETVTLSASEALSADIPAFSEDEITEGAAEGSDVSYSMKKDDKVIEVESDIHGEEAIAAHTYNVSTVYDDTMGVVYGGGSFTEGSFALIEYACKDGYILDGFYIDGKKYEGSISEDHSIRIKVTKDTEIEVRFVKGDDSDPTPVDPTPVDPTPVDPTPVDPTPVNPQPTPIVTPTPAAPAEIVDLPAVKISKPKAAKKKITVKWKKVSKKNLKKIGGIQIQVATDPGFTNIVKTATAGKKKTSKVIKGLQSKTKYYVRIRAYAAGNHVSTWKVKKVKIK